ncbi:PEP-CTERM sorting domain-containing protein [uncultured Albimonas sp.]|uniref:PEP-CTERM sorting domain-containing protein n=1 Tax=uncultured Albimonas sp. TaxID=1331701 RepID=UPI0030EEE9F2
MAAAALAPAVASALVHVEIGDAGSTFATAQAVDASTLTGISGTLGEGGNDLYVFVLSVPTYVSVGNLSPDVSLNESYDAFDIGFGTEATPLEYCFDCFFEYSGPGLFAFQNVLVGPGTYYLGIVDTDTFGGSALEAYSFDVILSEAPASVPLPGAAGLAVLALGALGLAARRRRG